MATHVQEAGPIPVQPARDLAPEAALVAVELLDLSRRIDARAGRSNEARTQLRREALRLASLVLAPPATDPLGLARLGQVAERLLTVLDQDLEAERQDEVAGAAVFLGLVDE